MNLTKEIIGQFKKPHGMLGVLAGAIMANRHSNIERNEWTLEQLTLKPSDRLLEIGFGPGIAIEKAARVITSGVIMASTTPRPCCVRQ
jgi:hypothetical protein